MRVQSMYSSANPFAPTRPCSRTRSLCRLVLLGDKLGEDVDNDLVVLLLLEAAVVEMAGLACAEREGEREVDARDDDDANERLDALDAEREAAAVARVLYDREGRVSWRGWDGGERGGGRGELTSALLAP